MLDWSQPIQVALDRAPGPVTFFFRDDDVGWSDKRLDRLLDQFEYHQLPLDLAVIPDTVGNALAAVLRARVRAMPGLLGLHQHGYSHANHEQVGRKCEFGVSRSARQQYRDLEQGQQRLQYYLGPLLIDPIFTPPWNRCTQTTVDNLLALGFAVLSRDKTAQALSLKDLAELPISVDWVQRRAGSRLAIAEIVEQLVHSIVSAKPVGIMLHHAIMEENDMQQLDTLLALLSQHPKSRFRLMRELAGASVITPQPVFLQ